MNFQFTEDQLAIAAMVRDLARAETPPSTQALAELGLLAIATDPELGGTGLGLVELCICLEELAAYHPSTARSLQVHNLWCVGAIQTLGTEAQKQRWIPPLETALGSFGSTTDGTRVDGVAHGEDASVVVVKQADGGLAVAPGPLPVLHRGKPLGFRATHPVCLSVEGVALDPLEGDGAAVGDRAQVGLAAVAVGLASGALREGARYASERRQFGQPIAHFQAIQFKIADTATAVDTARLMVHRAAWLADQGRSIATVASMARRVATDAALLATDHALQIHGGYGYTAEYAVEGFYRDARAAVLAESTNEGDRDRIAAKIIAY